eukprot:SAG22_NODE_3643_length_1597_cov_4.369826_3_plen_115_part_00
MPTGACGRALPVGAATKSAERQLSAEARKAARRERKQAAKQAKAGRVDVGRKPCELCQRPECEELIRCQATELWEGWRLVCGKCWTKASGGVADGDAAHPGYTYGGLWRFRKAP